MAVDICESIDLDGLHWHKVFNIVNDVRSYVDTRRQPRTGCRTCPAGVSIR